MKTIFLIIVVLLFMIGLLKLIVSSTEFSGGAAFTSGFANFGFGGIWEGLLLFGTLIAVGSFIAGCFV